MQINPQELNALAISSREVDRLIKTFALVPNDVTTALEIGFYDLRVTSLLRRRLDLTSIDLPRRVSAPDKTGLVFASLLALPFADRQFDLVICTEVLEHLRGCDLPLASSELMRATKKYLLVTVPFEQHIEHDIFKCSICGFMGNTMGHLHSFDAHRLRQMFEQMHLLRTDMIGVIGGRAPRWLYPFALRWGNVFYDYSFGSCPSCSKTNRSVSENAAGYIIRRILWRLERRADPKPAWIAMLFAQKQALRGAERESD